VKKYLENRSIKIENILKSYLENIFIFLLFLNYSLDFTIYFLFILIDTFSYYINSRCFIFENNFKNN